MSLLLAISAPATEAGKLHTYFSTPTPLHLGMAVGHS